MARIFSLHGPEHEDVQRLLPWYVTGQLDPVERARVEAHLAGCAECQAEVRSERRLKAEFTTLPPVERDWARLRRRLEAEALPKRAAGADRARVHWWVGWAIAAQIVVVAVLGLQLASSRAPAEYRTLSAPPPAAGARAIVTFRPESPEAALRSALNAAGARLVDGPTAANAYVLELAGGPAALQTLRAQPAVTAAELLDPAEPR
jgi:anti-sigma factor RsiW